MADLPAAGTLRERVGRFLAAHNTMTLASIGPNGEPQAAAVFYAAGENLALYFLSSPTSRHSVNLERDGRVAATIHADGQAWQAIQGLQIEGQACLVEGLRETTRAIRIYTRRFTFLKDLLEGSGADAPSTLRGPVASSRFYVLRPSWIRLIDNTQGFGHREELRLQKPQS